MLSCGPKMWWTESCLTTLATWAQEKGYRKKAIFEYTDWLPRCQDTGARWIAMIEDDTLALKGWCPRFIEALATANDQYAAIDNNNPLYLRLSFEESSGVEYRGVAAIRCRLCYQHWNGSRGAASYKAVHVWRIYQKKPHRRYRPWWPGMQMHGKTV